MDVFQEMPLKKRAYMERLFQNCPDEMKCYMRVAEVEEDGPGDFFGEIEYFADLSCYRIGENMRRLISQTADARQYLFIDGRERLMMHLIRKYEQKMPWKKALELKENRQQLSEEMITEEGYRQMKEHIGDYIYGKG